MVKVQNPAGNSVKQFFFGHGEVVIGPEEVKEIPKAVWDAWQSSDLWGGQECPLKIYVPPSEQEVKEDDPATPAEAQTEAAAAPVPEVKPEQAFKCKVCGEEFSSPQKLGAHVRKAHKQGD